MELRLPVLLILLSLLVLPAFATADEPDRATVQERYAPKEGRYYAHAAGTTLIRNDYYVVWGYGADIGYFPSETWGYELRVLNLHTRLSSEADRLRESHSLVPDLRAPDFLLAAGARMSVGYGKVLTMDRFVVHFDPQWTFHAGITFAEERYVPTTMSGLGILMHFQHGIQVKLDLQMSFQVENRDRGWRPSFGFVPLLAIGWSPTGEDR